MKSGMFYYFLHIKPKEEGGNLRRKKGKKRG